MEPQKPEQIYLKFVGIFLYRFKTLKFASLSELIIYFAVNSIISQFS